MPKKKVLIITYYWPPSGGPGVQRWLKFVKYLPDFDIEPIVLVPENPNYPIIDDNLHQDIPTHIKIYKCPINEPYKWVKLINKNKSKTLSAGIISEDKNQSLLEKTLLFIRGNCFIPDARKSWVNPATKIALEIMEQYDISTIITSGPPHSLHLIGLKIKQQKNVRWLADFRDPWTTIGYHKSLKLLSFAKKKHKQLEAKVLNTADEIIVTSPSTKAEFNTITNKPISVITNGYDVFQGEKPSLDHSFSIAHIGSMLTKRNPEIFWKALQELSIEIPNFKNDLSILFAGKTSIDVLQSVKDYGLENNMTNLGYLSHQEAQKLQRSSQLLLLVEINDVQNKAIIPGKLFEYMSAERPIIAIGPENADFFEIIKNTNTGQCFLYNDYTALKQFIVDCYQRYLNKNLNVHGIGIQYYSRKKLTQQLAKLLYQS